jgi:hypothetical protein
MMPMPLFSFPSMNTGCFFFFACRPVRSGINQCRLALNDTIQCFDDEEEFQGYAKHWRPSAPASGEYNLKQTVLNMSHWPEGLQSFKVLEIG